MTRAPVVVRRSAIVRPTGAAEFLAPDRALESGLASDPYPDYRIELTLEGGIGIIYKTVDDRWRYKIRAVLLWTIATWIDGWLLFAHTPVGNGWVKLGCAAAVVVANFLIVSKPVEVYRRIEIQPDRMILDGTDTFFLHHMHGDWPGFAEEGDRFVLSGIYGTRLVEYLNLPAFDEFDRAPQVLALHLEYAMQQLWTRPTSDPGAGPAPRPTRSRET